MDYFSDWWMQGNDDMKDDYIDFLEGFIGEKEVSFLRGFFISRMRDTPKLVEQYKEWKTDLLTRRTKTDE